MTRSTTRSLLTASTFLQHSLGLLPIGTSRLPARPLDRIGNELVEVFAELTNVEIRPLTTMFQDSPAWRAFASDPIDDAGRRYWLVAHPSRHTTADVHARLLLEARAARNRIDALTR